MRITLCSIGAASSAPANEGAAVSASRRKPWACLCAAVLTVVAAQGVIAAEGTTAVPSPVTILKDTGQTASGYVFYTQQHGTGAGNGPVIMDTKGRPVWFKPLSTGIAADFRIQTYHGQPVLTWIEGTGVQFATGLNGTDYIADTSYNVIATVKAGNGYGADFHEFELTPDGTALITVYHAVTGDESAAGGPVNGTILEGIAQEIDVATGNVIFEWRSLEHVGVAESYVTPPSNPTDLYDYFHINSIKLDTDNNLLISARNTSTLYKVDRKTGAVIWRLGGKKSDFALGAGLPFGWQHNAIATDASTIRIFDNMGASVSRVLWMSHDDTAKTAAVIRSIAHPDGIYAFAAGNAQALANGDTFVCWGITSRMSEFDSAGNLIYDVALPAGYPMYRAYRFPFVGHPTTTPSVSAIQHENGTVTVHAIWNGATEVAKWQVVGTAANATSSTVATIPWNGLDTSADVSGPLSAVQVVAIDASGNTLGSSASLSGPFPGQVPTITHSPISVTVASGSTAVMSVSAAEADSYQWSFEGAPLSDGTNAGANISGASTSMLVIRGATAANAGHYSCAATNSYGTATSSAAQLTVSDTTDIGRLINLSCRSIVSGGDNALIVGFVVGGTGAVGAENLSLQTSGPALTTFSVPGVLADPQFNLYNLGSATPLVTASIGSQNVPVGTVGWRRDITVTKDLSAGAYTATITSASGGSGVALVELSDNGNAAFSTSTPRLVNGSGRAQVGTGSNVLIAGFVIGGSTARTVLIRASGPTLAAFGINAALSDPQLKLYASGGSLVASNSAWAGNAQIAAAAARAGAFAWTDPSSKDSALLVTLPPGAYSAEVSGGSADTGVALVEVYDVF